MTGLGRTCGEVVWSTQMAGQNARPKEVIGMDIRRRVAQFLMVVAMAATSTAFTAGDASAMLGTEWCATSCGGTGVCDPCGGLCVPEPCFGIDGNWYDYAIYCFDC